MHRIQCSCKKIFRVRSLEKSTTLHDSLCRRCFRNKYGRSRPIEARALSENKYRRTRARRKSQSIKRIIPAAIRKRGKGASQTPIEG